jgi:hypothetical protein
MVFSAQAPVPYLSNLGGFYRFHKVIPAFSSTLTEALRSASVCASTFFTRVCMKA